MRECPEVDALTTIGNALSWQVEAGLEHLRTCAECRAQLEALQLAHGALGETEIVAEAALARIADAVAAAAQQARPRTQQAERWTAVAEIALAGIAAPIVLATGGFEIDSAAAGALTTALGAGLVWYGRRRRLHGGDSRVTLWGG